MYTETHLDLGRTFAVRLMQHLVVPTFVLDATRRVVIWNRACERLTGVGAPEVLGTRDHWRAFYDTPRYCLADTLILGRTEELTRLYDSHTVPSDNTLGLSAENWCVMPRAAKRLYLAIDAGPIFSEDGTLIAVVETLRDMTEQKLAQMALHSLANRDGLTGLANRRAFDTAIVADCQQAQRDTTALSVLLADVDHFKAYNDTHGHQKGDECLRTVAQAIEAQIFRQGDLAARYGGEEFAILLPNVDLAGALQVAERVRAAVEALHLPHGGRPDGGPVTLSIGAASGVPWDGPDILIATADEALYTAKRAGRNRVVGNAVTRPTLVEELYEA
ncbi:sensor domain-containing diguanylate cyclase [Pararhodospirillum photometricum]|uniref:diguanylate cyclase n=1 Tax=Pararhodospirillum photometricum DSM 122 TaxID=1150469 RepID=H6SQV9_PARPM|nr:diguanylate cyclase [Pararhodospirillum photometricum]CCG07424.1 Response regulator containing a CheY-like receiver domain and a GGDEF domain [Pararhodospirillum photometricum DSM 122]